jgi:hypothetical protein
MLALVMNETVNALLPARLLRLMQSMNPFCAKSPKRDAQFGRAFRRVAEAEKLGRELSGLPRVKLQLRKQVKKLYTKRWSGCNVCAESALQNMPGWVELRKELVNDGFGPTADDASDSSEEEGEDDDEDEMIDRIDQDPAADSATINELLTHHAPALGRASSLDDPLTESLAVPADKKMRLKLLHRHHGISIANHGRLAYFKDFLEVFSTAGLFSNTQSSNPTRSCSIP